MLSAFLALAALAAAGTLRNLYRVGRSLNDHAMAAMVLAVDGVYALLAAAAARDLGPVGAGLALAGLSAGPLLVAFLFRGLAARRDPGRAWVLVAASQPAASFAFWCAWLLVFRAVASWAWAPLPSWPGRWLLLPAGLSAWGTAWALGPGRAVRRFRLPVAGLPAPLRLVHVSDLHFGLNAPARRVRRLVERVRRLGPDLVALTGDLITPFSETTWTPLVPLLADLCVPVLVCPGNHDRAIAHRMGPALEAAGLTWLADRTATLDVKGVRVEAVGLDFRYRGIRAHVLSTLPSLPPGPADLRLLLCHDPRCLRSVPGGRFHLALAGHLHGGPVAGDFLGLQGSPVRWTGTPDHGLFRRGTTLAHVSSGNVDVTFPPRLGSASEIAVIELVPA